IDAVLTGLVGAGAQQRGEGTTSQRRHYRPDLPTLSEASEGANPRKLVNHAGIKVQPDIRVARTLVTLGVVGILHDRKRGRTAAVYGIGINTIRPRKVDHSIEPMPITLTISRLQGIIAGVSIIGQLDDVIEVGHTIQLVHGIERARTVPGLQLLVIDGIPTAHRPVI